MIAKRHHTAEGLCVRMACIERVGFTNSGTEGALVARAATGQPLVFIASIGYHSLQRPRLRDGRRTELTYILIADHDDLSSLRRVLDAWGHKFAAVLVEALQSSRGIALFLQGLHNVARRAGCVFIMNEVLTERLDTGGARAGFGIQPDLNNLGKVIGPGLTPAGVERINGFVSMLADELVAAAWEHEPMSVPRVGR